VDLSAGLTTPVATYGAGQRVTGVIIRHPDLSPDTYAIEVHVILSETPYLSAAPQSAARAPQESAAETSAQPRPFTEIADRIRMEARRAAQTRVTLSTSAIDVYIDDLR
jgi:hypothetical protein